MLTDEATSCTGRPGRSAREANRSEAEALKRDRRPPAAPARPFAGLGRCLVARLRVGPGPLKAEEARDARDPVKWSSAKTVLMRGSLSEPFVVLLAGRDADDRSSTSH